MITDIEKTQLAQHYFNECFRCWGYSICGIANFYNYVLQIDGFYKNKENEKLIGYKELEAFHTFKPIEESTKIKLIELTKNCFKQMGYNVNSDNLEEKLWKLK